MEEGCNFFAKKNMNGLPDFSNLSADDQTKLIASNVPLLHVFQEAGCVGDPNFGLSKGLSKGNKYTLSVLIRNDPMRKGSEILETDVLSVG